MVRTLLAQTFFMPFSLTCMALLARMHALLQDLATHLSSLYSRVSAAVRYLPSAAPPPAAAAFVQEASNCVASALPESLPVDRRSLPAPSAGQAEPILEDRPRAEDFGGTAIFPDLATH